MDKKMGAGTIDARIVLGALIIKHHEDLSDEGTIESIKENLYMQYFLGLSSFKRDAVFVPSLFVEIRKRLGLDYWQEINDIIIKHNTSGSKNDSQENKDNNQEKPRTYRITARKNYLNIAKKKRRTNKEIRKAIGKQLNYVYRDLKYIDSLLLKYDTLEDIFTRHELKYLQVVNQVYSQQREMHTTKTHSIPNRIVSINQPQVRPMVRGKAGSDVKFGSKIGVCVHDGLTYLDQLSWDSYNETGEL